MIQVKVRGGTLSSNRGHSKVSHRSATGSFPTLDKGTKQSRELLVCCRKKQNSSKRQDARALNDRRSRQWDWNGDREVLEYRAKESEQQPVRPLLPPPTSVREEPETQRGQS